MVLRVPIVLYIFVYEVVFIVIKGLSNINMIGLISQWDNCDTTEFFFYSDS
jgi:hypothetical protein